MKSEQHIELWVSNEEFDHIKAAARLSGRSISQFLVDAGLCEAQTLEEIERERVCAGSRQVEEPETERQHCAYRYG